MSTHAADLPTSALPSPLLDVAVIGGGAAGLSAAIALARSRRSVTVIDAGSPRNASATGMHNVLGHEGLAPTALLAAGRADLLGYGGTVVPAAVQTATRDGGVFALTTDTGTVVRARRLVLATGLVDELPEIPGVAEHWGESALHCPYCHGWEVRDRRIAVLGTGPMSVHQAQLFRQLSAHVVLIDHALPALTDDERAGLAARRIELIGGPVARLHGPRGALTGVELADGALVDADAVVVAPHFVVRTDLYAQLGGTPTAHPMGLGTIIPTDPMGRTELDGVWAAGNAADHSAMVAVSMGAGMLTGAAVNADLVTAELQRAVAG